MPYFQCMKINIKVVLSFIVFIIFASNSLYGANNSKVVSKVVTGLGCPELYGAMGDGIHEMKTDTDRAFELQERDHPSGKMKVTSTSCRMVSFETFEKELAENGLSIIETGITEALPDFDSLMYAVAGKK